jgi:hypothetical protein
MQSPAQQGFVRSHQYVGQALIALAPEQPAEPFRNRCGFGKFRGSFQEVR